MASGQTEVEIKSLSLPGQITFNKVTNATQYRVEWSSSAGGSWTSFAGAAASLDRIISPGLGVATTCVPMCYRVVATITIPQNTPSNMVLIPEGSFVMGNATNIFPTDEGSSDELPQHTVYVSAFHLDIYEVTKSIWDEVKAYSESNGYTYSKAGSGKSTNHPVYDVNWYDVVKWCNARSQRDGLTPVYYTDAGFTTVYKTNEITPLANWAANGYRLPTEAEWEKAARGGAADTRFPWTDYTNNISHAKANYCGANGSFTYDLSSGYHPTFATGDFPYTSTVGYFAPNGYGLYDMAGNVWEWCWDLYDSGYYASSPGTDPRGPAAGPLMERVLRGGSWDSHAIGARCALRLYGPAVGPDYLYTFIGFRCARGISMP